MNAEQHAVNRMEREISDSATIIYKFVIPIFVNIICIPLAGLAILRTHHDPLFFAIAVLLSGVSLYKWWEARNLKKLAMDGSFLYIYSGSKKYQTPLNNIASIEESAGSNVKFVTVRLREPEEFGKKIVFIPRYEYVSLFVRVYPVLDELRARAGIRA